MAWKLPTQIYPCTYVVPCETYNCRNRAKWFVGRPDAPVSTNYRLCDTCAKSIVENLPDELKVLLVAPEATEPSEPVGNQTEQTEPVEPAEAGPAAFKCDKCGKEFDKEQALKMHKVRAHGK